MRIVLRTTVLLLSLLFAGFVGVSTFVIGAQVKAPTLASAIAWPIATLAPANEAYNGYSTRLSRNPAARVTTAERKKALTAYLSEPLSVPGLALLETSRRVASDPATNFAYLRTVSQLSRRTTYVNRRLAEIYGRQGDTVHMFRWLSRTAKTNRDFERAYVASLAASLSLRGAVEGITSLVGEDPPWREEFWRLAVRNTPALDRAAAIRKNLIRAPWRQTRIDQDEHSLLEALAAAGRFDTALDLASALASANHIRSFAPQGQLVRNDRFRTQPRLEPFDWRLSSSDIVSAIYPKEPGLSVGAITGSSGSAAQQLIKLTPGAYSLAWSISAFEKWGARQVAVRLRCAETGIAVAPIDPVFLDDKAANVRVTVPAGDCGWYWLSLDIAVPDDGSGMDIVVNRLSLAAVASGSEAPAAMVPTAAKPAIVAP